MEEKTHIVKKFDNFGVESLVLLLETSPQITEEARAMLCALYSRSPDTILSHLELVKKRGAQKFMESYYVGYGHQSIGDNGSGTFFIENISMLAAKAIQHTPLYAGQEVSTRYVDFGKQPFLNPLGTEEGKEIQETWRRLYLDSIDKTVVHLRERYPNIDGTNEKTWIKAINAKAFDVLRGFLPAGSVTSIAYHSSLRQIADHMLVLRHHPLPEVRKIAEKITEAAQEGFPSSFGHKLYDTTENFMESSGRDYYFFDQSIGHEPVLITQGFDENFLSKYEHLLRSRPIKTELPNFVNLSGSLSFEFLIDFASYRDLQRHRSVYQAMPQLTTFFGFEKWYLDQLPSDVRENAERVLEKQIARINSLGIDGIAKQYYLPMGLKVSHKMSGPIGKLLYIIELRATKFVHPTLAKLAYQMGNLLKKRYGSLGLAVHVDENYDAFDVRRGNQDITRLT